VTTADEPRRQRRTGVAERLLSVVSCFSMRRRELTLTEISKLSGLPLSTAKRLIAELCEVKMLERTEQGAYRIGIRLWQLGSLAPDARDLREAALPYMHDLSNAVAENVQLLALSGSEGVVIERISARQAVPTRTDVGGRLPLHATAVGKVLLAYAPEPFLGEFFDRELARFTRSTITDPAVLRDQLHSVRTTGVGYSYEEMSTGAVSIAAPIFATSTGGLRGALGIVTHTGVDLDRLGPALKTASAGVSRLL
jgi:DNA-binding IclR family transcriptional regulator